MPDKAWRRLPHKLFMALLLFLATAPITVLMVAAFMPQQLWMIYLAVYAVFMPVAAGVLAPNRRLLCGGVLLIGLYTQSGLLIPWGGDYGLVPLVYPLVLTALLAFSLRASAMPAEEEWPGGLLVFFGFAHVVAYGLLRIDTFAPGGPLLAWFAPLFMLCMLLQVNGDTLRMGVSLRKDHKPPRRIVARNRGMLALFVAVILAIVNIRHLRAAYYKALEWFLIAVAWLLDMFTRLYPMQSEGGGGGGGGGDLGLPMEDAQPGWLALLLERILKYVVIVILIALAVFVVYFLGKKLLRLLRILRDKWAAYASSLNTAYEDEAESLFDWGEMAQSAQDRVRDFMTRLTERKPSWQAMDNRARIRYAYKTLLKKHPHAPDTHTANTLLRTGELPVRKADAAHLARAYDAARYSERPISDEDAENAKRAID